MSDYSNLFGMFGDKESAFGACPPPPGPPPCPPPCPPPPGPPPVGAGFGGNSIIIWIIILFFLCRGGFGFGNNGCGCGNNQGGCGCGNNFGGCGCGNNFGGYGVGNYGYETGCCTTMIPNPCDYTEYCNCCGKKVKKCKKQKNYIVEMCQCGGNVEPVYNNYGNCGCGNNGFGFGTGFWWIIILIILFVFRGGSGLIGGAPIPPGPPPFPPPRTNQC